MRSNFFFTFILLFLTFLGSCTVSNLNKSEKKIPNSNIITEINNPTPIPTITPIPTTTNTPIPTIVKKISETPATSTPTVTNTPEPPSSYTNEIAKLIFEKNIDSKQIILTSVIKTFWEDKSMNCPEPGIYYEKFTPPDHGFIYILESDKEKWEYHSDSSGKLTINCTEVRNNMTDTINISQNNLFEKAISIKIYRNNQQKVPVLTGEITDKNEIIYISELLITFDLSTTILEAQILKKPVLSISLRDYGFGKSKIFLRDTCKTLPISKSLDEIKMILSKF